jgi:hypothetical protein
MVKSMPWTSRVLKAPVLMGLTSWVFACGVWAKYLGDQLSVI